MDDKTPESRERQENGERKDPSQLNAIEKFYENFRNVPLKYLDAFIGICIAALVIVIVLGIIQR